MKLFGLQVTQFDTILEFSFNTFIEYYIIERNYLYYIYIRHMSNIIIEFLL